MPAPIPRMKAEDRRESVLAAATVVFGEYGYVGTTTDRVARAAGVSQPYVVRMFGTKEQLFVEVLERASGRLLATFRRVLAQHPGDSPSEELGRSFGRAYVELLSDRGLLLSLMHGFVSGGDPVIGPLVRRGFLDVYTFLRTEAGFDAERVREFLASGMLLNTIVGLRMGDEFETNETARELMHVIAPEKLDLILSLGETQRAEAGER